MNEDVTYELQKLAMGEAVFHTFEGELVVRLVPFAQLERDDDWADLLHFGCIAENPVAGMYVRTGYGEERAIGLVELKQDENDSLLKWRVFTNQTSFFWFEHTADPALPGRVAGYYADCLRWAGR